MFWAKFIIRRPIKQIPENRTRGILQAILYMLWSHARISRALSEIGQEQGLASSNEVLDRSKMTINMES